MSGQDVRVRSEGPVRYLVIDRPEVRNAYRSATCQELAAGIDDAVRDDDIRVLVLAGAGGAFCAGGDLSSVAEIESAHSRQFGHGAVMREGMHRVIRALDACDKPVIAAIDGPAISGGLTLALACDFRIGSDRARLGDASTRVGLLPDEGGAWYFQRFMGRDRALRMSLLHEVYDAAQALAYGLLTQVVPAGRLDDEVAELAGRLARTAPLSTRMVKRLTRRATGSTLEDALADAELAVDLINDSADVAEGIAAFLGKREPRFEGR